MRSVSVKMLFWCVLAGILIVPGIRSCADPVAWMGGLFTTGEGNDYPYIFADPPKYLGEYVPPKINEQVRTLGISAIRYTYDEEDRQKQFRITTNPDPNASPATTYTGDIKKWIGNAMSVTQLDIPSENISDCSGTRLGIQVIFRDTGDVHYYHYCGIRAFTFDPLLPENQLVSRYIINGGITPNSWEPPIKKRELFSSIKNHVITALSMREIRIETPDTIKFDYEYSMFTRDQNKMIHLYVFPQKALDHNFPLDLAPYEIPAGDIQYMYPFLNLTSDLITGFAICDEPDAVLNEILIIDHSDGTQGLYYIGCPQMQANPLNIRLNSRTEYPEEDPPDQSGDIEEFRANVNPRTGLFRTREWSVTHWPDENMFPTLLYNPMADEQNAWEASYFENAPAAGARTLDYTHPGGIDISTILKNVYAIGNPDPEDKELPPCNAMLNIDDPTTYNGLYVGAPIPPSGFSVEHPYISGDIPDDATIKIHWDALVDIDSDSLLTVDFFRFAYIPQSYPHEASPTPTPSPVFSCNKIVTSGSSNVALSFMGNDFRSHFPGPERYYMIASLRLNPAEDPYSWSNGGPQNPMDWFYVDRMMSGHVFETYYNKGPGNPGPWSTGHHHMWAEIASQKMIRDSWNRQYIIYHDLTRKDGSGGSDYWMGETKDEGLVEFSLAHPQGSFHKLEAEDFAPTGQESWIITNLRISDLVHTRWNVSKTWIEKIFVVVITDETWKENNIRKEKKCVRAVTYNLGSNDWEKNESGKIIHELVDHGDLFGESFLQLSPYGPQLPALDGVLQSPVAAISLNDDGSPRALYVAMEYGYAGPGGFLTMLNYGLWDGEQQRFNFQSRDIGDACWAYFGAGVGAQICVSRLQDAPVPGLETFVHIFNNNNHLMICEGNENTEGTLIYYNTNLATHNVWHLTETPFPGFEETLWNKYESELGSGFLLRHFNVVQPDSSMPGERMHAGGYPLVERVNDNIGETIHLISNVTFGPGRYSPVLIYTKLTDYGFDSQAKTYWANWPDCSDYGTFVVQDNLLQSVYGIQYMDEMKTGFPPDCNNEGRLLPDIVVRPYLSIDEISGSLLAVWQNIHQYYNVCEFDTVFNRSYKILYKIKPTTARNWMPGRPAGVLDRDTSMGAFFPVAVRHQQLNPDNPRFSLIYCAGENYSYSSTYNHDYSHPERFNYNIYPTYHSLIRDQIPL